MAEQNAKDNVNFPSYYTQGNIEVIDFIEDKDLNFHLGNVIKYVARNGRKKSKGRSVEEKALEDLKKAQWYLAREIRRRERRLTNAAD